MRLIRRCGTVLSAFGLLWGASGASAQDIAKGPIGYLDPQMPRAVLDAYRGHEKIGFPDPQKPLFEAKEVSHVANGVALRDRARGVIHSRGVPLKSQIVRSFLFWNFSDGNAKGADTSPALFEGNLVVGRKTADNTDPCWGRAGNHSYVADVTAFTNQSGGSNQEYEVVIAFNEKTSTSGQNPWFAQGSSEVLLEGATLVVIYKNENTRGALYVFAPPGDNMFTVSATYFLPVPGPGRALFSEIGADGQRGGGHDNAASNEITWFDVTQQIAGPPVAASDWDGSDGLTLPQLWDTHTHWVDLRQQVARVDYDSVNGDCLVPVGFVLDQE